MSPDLSTPTSRKALADFYQQTLLQDVMPFWLRHGMDPEHGGLWTCLDRDGSLLDTDKSVWFQGRGGWMFATLYNTVEARPEWLEAAQSCVNFSRQHCHSNAADGKMWFSVTREGQPLRMRRYVYSECFAAISYAATAKATGSRELHTASLAAYATFLRHNFEPGVMPPKFENTRPGRGIGPHMMSIATAQELRENLGEVTISGKSCTEWIDWHLAEIRQYFFKPELRVVMEAVGLEGEIINHTDFRTLNPGHAIECAWFIMHEGQHRGDRQLIAMGCQMLDCMWERGWDQNRGGLRYFVDYFDKPVQEYWHDMRFWWNHCEAIIATLLAWKLTGEARYAEWHRQVHDYSFQHFSDPEHGEWFGYLHLDGTVSQTAKGNMFKGPFHLPRMLWYAHRLLQS
jgi:N-acylglucosamine 2-epimerase